MLIDDGISASNKSEYIRALNKYKSEGCEGGANIDILLN
jgi:hypothetical protein